MNKYKPYKLHPYPWTIDRGTIRTADGDVIGHSVYSLGDEIDHSSGRLMARAPELLDLMSLTLQTIGDVLRSEPDMRQSNREVLEEISQELREAIHERD
jgi:hypothetical protein